MSIPGAQKRAPIKVNIRFYSHVSSVNLLMVILNQLFVKGEFAIDVKEQNSNYEEFFTL